MPYIYQHSDPEIMTALTVTSNDIEVVQLIPAAITIGQPVICAFLAYCASPSAMFATQQMQKPRSNRK